MRRGLPALLVLIAGGSVFAVSGRAQNAPIQATPLPPLQEQAPPAGAPGMPPGGYLQAPMPQAPMPQAPMPQAPMPQALGAPMAAPQVPGAPMMMPQGAGPQGTGPQGTGPQGTGSQGTGSQGTGPQAGAGLGAPETDGQNPAATPSVPPPTVSAGWPDVWLPAGGVKLQALDKVNAQATALTIKVGQTATFGSLTIAVKACAIRPADQPADAAAYLDVTDSHKDSPGFDGWMLADEPSVSMMQHPIYDLRVTGCTDPAGPKG
jgi:hypothetical protein